MKKICMERLLALVLPLVLCVSQAYAIKKPVKKIKLPVKQGRIAAKAPKVPTGTTTPKGPVSTGMLEAQIAKAPKPSTVERPLQHLPLNALGRGLGYMRKSPTSMTPAAALQVVADTQHEIAMRVQAFVTKQGRWMEGSMRGSRTPFQSEAAWNKYTVKGVTKEEMELANLATQIILYGDEKYPAVTQLIELYESFGHAGKKGLVESMRNVIEFSKREDDLLRAGIYNPEFMTEGKKLLKEMTDRMPEHVYHGDDLVLNQCYNLIANMQERNSYRYHLNLLEDFIAREGRIPQTYGWNGKDQTKAQYSEAQQEEYHLYATAKRLMSLPTGENVVLARIRQLWKQYGGQ